MNCKKCGSPLMENDHFCKGCGAAVNNVKTQNVGMNYTQQAQNTTGGQVTQQTWANGYNAQPNYNQMSQKNNNNTKFIIIGVVIAVVIFVAAVVFNIFAEDDNSTNSELSNSGSNSTNTVSDSTYKVNFKGFSFKIPTNLVYETENDSILLGDEDGTWGAYIEVVEGSYNQLLKNKSQLSAVYQQDGYTASSAVEKTIGGMSFITLEISGSGYNALLGLTKANSMYVFGVTAFNLDNEYDYDILETVASILSSAEYTGETNNMEVNKKVDMSNITGLAK